MSTLLLIAGITIILWLLIGTVLLALLYAFGENTQRQPDPDEPV